MFYFTKFFFNSFLKSLLFLAVFFIATPILAENNNECKEDHIKVNIPSNGTDPSFECHLPCSNATDKASELCDKGEWLAESNPDSVAGTGTALGVLEEGFNSGSTKIMEATSILGATSAAVLFTFAKKCKNAVTTCINSCEVLTSSASNDVCESLALEVEGGKVKFDGKKKCLDYLKENKKDKNDSKLGRCEALKEKYIQAFNTAQGYSLYSAIALGAASMLGDSDDDKKKTPEPEINDYANLPTGTGNSPSVLSNSPPSASIAALDDKGLPEVPDDIDNDGFLGDEPENQEPAPSFAKDLGGSPRSLGSVSGNALSSNGLGSGDGASKKKTAGREAFKGFDYLGSEGGSGSVSGFSGGGYQKYRNEKGYPLKRRLKIAKNGKKPRGLARSSKKGVSERSIFHQASYVIQKFCREGKPCR